MVRPWNFGALSQRISDDILIAVMQRFGLFLICIFAVALQPRASIEQIAGAPLKGQLVEPFSAGFDPSGNLYICEYQCQRITREGRDGVEQRFAGTGVKGFSGDGGPAGSAQLNDPHSIFCQNWDVHRGHHEPPRPQSGLGHGRYYHNRG